MKKLDKTKVYYLGDLNDEQYFILLNKLNINVDDDFCNIIQYYNFKWNLLCIKEPKYNTNALTLFQTNKNDRIIEIQLRIQELNNEILELDEELTRLTYEEN